MKDLVDDREHDIFFHDRTDYDEKVAYLVSDYIKLTHDLIRAVRSNSGLSNQLDEILNKKAKSVSRDGRIRTLGDIISGRFDIPKVWRIDCPSDDNAIFDKFDDFSPKTIEQLIENGKSDAIISLSTLEVLFTIKDLPYANKSDIEELYHLMKKPKQWLIAHLYYRQKGKMTRYITEFIAEVDTMAKLPPEKRELLKDLSYNILDELKNETATSNTTISRPSLQFQTV